jgi:cation:H+ antiporter
MVYFLVAIGLALLFAGGEALVRGSVGLSRLLGFSPLLIGLVVMSASTSAPELFVSLRAVLADHPDIAAGNIIGSNIANILLILGLAALIRPLPTSPKIVFREGATMLLASIAFVIFAWDGVVTRSDGICLLAGLLLFMVVSFGLDWRKPSPHAVFATRAATRANGELYLGVSLFYLAIGVALLYFGAGFILNGSLAIARHFALAESFIGLTLVAVGTALPELVVTIAAARKGQTGLAIGNILGSNIFNILGVLGITSLVRPVAISGPLSYVDAPIMAAVAGVLLPLLMPQWRLGTRAGIGFVLGYCAYVLLLVARQAFGLGF